MSVTRRGFLGATLATMALPRLAFADELESPLGQPERMPPAPALYVGHGGPNLAVSRIRGAELAGWAAQLAAPMGVVGITPHTRAHGVRLTAIGRGRPLISFPRRFLPNADTFTYDSSDSGPLADSVEQLLANRYEVTRGGDGINHTIWQPLLHMRPQADMPVLEIALPFDMNDRQLFELGQTLAPLRERGIWILASGNLTHNLAQMGRRGSAPWARRFDSWVEARLAAQDVDALVDWRSASPDAFLAHPDDGGHYDVLLVALGAAQAALGAVSFPVEGFEGSSLSKRCIQIG